MRNKLKIVSLFINQNMLFDLDKNKIIIKQSILACSHSVIFLHFELNLAVADTEARTRPTKVR